MIRTECAGCGSGQLTVVLDLGTSPVADYFPASPDEQLNRYPLQMAVCEKCWLAQLLCVVDDEILYGDDYGFYTGSSPAAAAAFRQLAAELHERWPDGGVAEIACNDGTLLGAFPDSRLRIGIEPSGTADAARERGLNVIREPFTEATGKRVKDEYGPFGLVVACNVIAHVTDPLDFLRGVRHLLAADGAAVFEFQDLEALVAGCQFDHVYHEHRFFYSLPSFSALAAMAELFVRTAERIPAQGGSLRVTLTGRMSNLPSDPRWLQHASAYASLQPRADLVKRRLPGIIAGFGTVAGYAASAKSATLLNFCELNSSHLAWIEDVTPGKIGRYTPGTGIPIRMNHETPDAYLLLAWNYLGAILRREQAFMQQGGKFIVPIPDPVII